MTVVSAFADLKNDYTAAKQSRFRRKRAGVTGIGHNADYHYRVEVDFLRMLETARDIDRNDVVIGQGINRAVSNIIQKGLTLDTNTGDETIDQELQGRWKEWGSDRNACHAAGKFTWTEIERLALRHTMVDGDIFGLPLKDGTLDLVESHRARTPRNTQKNVIHGIMLDSRGRPKEYWFTKRDIGTSQSLTRVSDMDRRRARDEMGFPEVIHLFCPDRVSQSRGVSVLSRIVDAASMHDDIEFAKLVQQQVVSCFGFIHKRANNDTQQGARTTQSRGDGSTELIEGISPGMKVYVDIEDEIEGFSPNVPNAEFFKHAELILTFLAINLGLPLAVLMLDPRQTNFSGWRGAMNQARLGFEHIQTWLASSWHREIYRWKVRQWMSEDEDLAKASMTGTVDIYGHSWNPPSWPYIEPLKDAAADLLQQRNALNSPRRIHAEKGREWSEVAREIVEDNSLAIRMACEEAQSLTKKCGTDIHWRELLSLPTPDGVVVTIDAGQDESNNGTENNA